MNWIVLVLLFSFFNAWWTALTQKKEKSLSPMQFTIMFRFFTILFLMPFFLLNIHNIKLSYNFLLFAFLYAVVEALRTTFIVKGAEEDYYATYAFVNTSPIFTLMIAYAGSLESINTAVIAGTVITVTGGFLFYKIGRFSKWGLMVSVISGAGSVVAKLGVQYSDGLSFSVVSFIILVIQFTIIEFIVREEIVFNKLKANIKTIIKPAFLSSIGTYFYFKSLEIGEITRIASLSRINLIFGFIFSYFMLKEIKDWKMKLAGGTLILLGVVIVTLAK